MANKTTRPEGAAGETLQPEQPLLALEALRKKHKIARPIFAGVCAANNWKPGRAMTEEEFLRAVADFTGAPMGVPQGK
ncbi:MAG: hypothetical protein K2L38_11790 [Dysosmobacter sp.]|nr:hypothetical protein [Dysosmobacter sp.]